MQNKQKHPQKLSASPSVRLSRRPILVMGVWMMAAVVLAIIVLTPSIAGVVGVYKEGMYARGIAFSLAAYIVLLFSLPCLIGIVLTTMFNIYIPRKFRLTIASIAYGIMTCLAWLSLFTCLVPAQSLDSARMLSLMLTIVDGGWWVVLILGAGTGLSLPVTARAHRHVRTYRYLRQHRTHVALVLLAWLFAAGACEALILSTTYFEVLRLTAIPYVAWMCALPLSAFFAIAAACAAWARNSRTQPSTKLARLDAFFAYAILAAATLYWPSLLPLTWIGAGILGAAFGLAVANMKK